MPVHDWTLVEAGIFHALHVAWMPEIQRALNGGLLPPGYYALPEQHAGQSIADVLTLHASQATREPLPPAPNTGGTAVAEAPPRVSRRHFIDRNSIAGRRRTLAVRHVSGHRLVAILEIVSPSNKDRARSVNDFATKAAEALEFGVHVLVIDLLPPGLNDPHGMHEAISQRIDQSDIPYDLPRETPLTLASYAAGPRIEAFVEHLAPGQRLQEMPLFLRTDRYVSVPLEPTYQAAYGILPAFWRDVLEGRKPLSQ